MITKKLVCVILLGLTLLSFTSLLLVGAFEFRLTPTGPQANEIPLGGVFYVVATEFCTEDADIQQVDGSIFLVNLRTSNYIWLPLKARDRDLVAGPIQARGPHDEATIPYSLEAVEGDSISAQTGLVGGLITTARVGPPVISLSTPIALPGTTVRLTLNLAPERDLPRLHLVPDLPAGWQALPEGIMTVTTDGFLWPKSLPEGRVTALSLLIEVPPGALGRHQLTVYFPELDLKRKATLVVAEHLPPEVVVAHWDVETKQLDLTLSPTIDYEQLRWAASHVGERLPYTATELSKQILGILTKRWQSEQTAYLQPVLPTAPPSETEKPEQEIAPEPEEKEEEPTPPSAPPETEMPEETQEKPEQPSQPQVEVGPLVAHWTFDEGTGSIAADETGGGNTATLYSISWTEGKLGSAVTFCGTEAYAKVPNSNSLGLADAFTITAWVSLAEVGTARQVLLQKKAADQSDVYTNYTLYVQWAHDALALIVGDGERRVGYLSERGIGVADEWHHVAVAFGNGEVQFYIDGELAGEESTTIRPHVNNGPLLIGCYTNVDTTSKFFLHGLLDDLRIYNKALTPEEIKKMSEDG